MVAAHVSGCRAAGVLCFLKNCCWSVMDQRQNSCLAKSALICALRAEAAMAGAVP